MICLSLPGPTVAEAIADYQQLKNKIDSVELRLDLFSEKDITSFTAQCTHTVIVTHSLDEAHHDFYGTPQNILKSIPQGSFKCAWTAQSILDSWRVLEAQADTTAQLMCMGQLGEITRILAPKFGGTRIYAAASKEKKTAPGQLTVDELIAYRVPQINRHTKLYGLIGDPVATSLSPEFHNRVFADKGINACYIKMSVRPYELASIIPILRTYFSGVSVTMPHKEAILSYVDTMDSEVKQIGATNTLRIHQGKIHAFNTDGRGACDCFETLNNKTLLLLGTGGAARPIAWEAKQRGAQVFVWGRNCDKARQFATDLNIAFTPNPNISYDFLINATASLEPISETYLLPHTTVMDIHSTPASLPFLEAAHRKGCRTIHGKEMFVKQALKQSQLFLD
ncbi:MAG: type I 3-dehydroquinate dehydratase [Chlamydiia bacterium]|nr:type I 3-dehydroquinate dehydratase [Chlamydiia bacterium]